MHSFNRLRMAGGSVERPAPALRIEVATSQNQQVVQGVLAVLRCEPATTLNAARRRKPLIDLSDEHEMLVKPERRFTGLTALIG